MGMTDAQFKSHIRFLLMFLQTIEEETDPKKKQAKFDELKENLQKTLED